MLREVDQKLGKAHGAVRDSSSQDSEVPETFRLGIGGASLGAASYPGFGVKRKETWNFVRVAVSSVEVGNFFSFSLFLSRTSVVISRV